MKRSAPTKSKSFYRAGMAARRTARKAFAAGDRDEARKLFESARHLFDSSTHPSAPAKSDECAIEIARLPAPALATVAPGAIEEFYAAVRQRSDVEIEKVTTGEGTNK